MSPLKASDLHMQLVFGFTTLKGETYAEIVYEKCHRRVALISGRLKSSAPLLARRGHGVHFCIHAACHSKAPIIFKCIH